MRCEFTVVIFTMLPNICVYRPNWDGFRWHWKVIQCINISLNFTACKCSETSKK